MNLIKITNEVATLARITGEFIRDESQHFNSEMAQEKGTHDLVSYVDKTAEEKLIEGLSSIIPEAGFIAEENDYKQVTGGLNWIIDPLDGTTNFIHGLPLYAISIALMNNNEVVCGVIYEINLDECFIASKGNGAFLNHKPIKVSKTNRLYNSLIATGFPYSDYSRLDAFMHTIHYFMRNSRGLRRLGSAATDLAYVACGRFDGFYEYALKPWDVAAGDIIIREAGGKVCDFNGESNYIFGQEIVAANPFIFEEFKTVINNLLHKPLL